MLKIVVQMLVVVMLFHCLSGAHNMVVAQKIKGGIRYDFLLVGNSGQAEAIFVQAKFLPKWSGTALPPETIDLYGNYRYRITDGKSGEVLFFKGFSPLFWEWQSTQEALYQKRSFYMGCSFLQPVEMLWFGSTDVIVWGNGRPFSLIHSKRMTKRFCVRLRSTMLSIQLSGLAPPLSTIDLVILSEGTLQLKWRNSPETLNG
jgi:hypothetical protein